MSSGTTVTRGEARAFNSFISDLIDEGSSGEFTVAELEARDPKMFAELTRIPVGNTLLYEWNRTETGYEFTARRGRGASQTPARKPATPEAGPRGSAPGKLEDLFEPASEVSERAQVVMPEGRSKVQKEKVEVFEIRDPEKDLDAFFNTVAYGHYGLTTVMPKYFRDHPQGETDQHLWCVIHSWLRVWSKSDPETEARGRVEIADWEAQKQREAAKPAAE